MGFQTGITEVGSELMPLCEVPSGGVLVKNLGGSRVHFGGDGITTEGDGAGYPLDAGDTETFPGVTARESPVVPAPPDDLAPRQLFARTADGSGISRVAWMTVS